VVAWSQEHLRHPGRLLERSPFAAHRGRRIAWVAPAADASYDRVVDVRRFHPAGPA